MCVCPGGCGYILVGGLIEPLCFRFMPSPHSVHGTGGLENRDICSDFGPDVATACRPVYLMCL